MTTVLVIAALLGLWGLFNLGEDSPLARFGLFVVKFIIYGTFISIALGAVLGIYYLLSPIFS